MTLTLAAFLEARLSEDEAAARACLEMFPTPWEISDRGWRVRIYASEIPTEDFTSDDAGAMTVRYPVVMEVEPDHRIIDPLWLSDRVAHIVRHDPARVLAEVAVKRAVLDAHRKRVEDDDQYDRIVASGILLRHHAAIYSDHPDYDESWRP